MEKFLKYAIDLIENDNELVEYRIEIQSNFVKLIQGSRYESIKEIVDNFFAYSKPNKSLFYLRAICFLEDKKFQESRVALSQAISLSEDNLNSEQAKIFKQLEIEIVERERNETRDTFFEAFVARKWAPEPETKFVRRDLTTSNHEFQQREKAISKNIPSILIISMARAASSKITTQIADYLGSSRVDIHSQSSPLDEGLVLGFLLDFKRGGAVSYTHCRASGKNLNILKSAKLNKFLVHLRDPRQCFLSNYYRMHAANDWAYYRTYYNDLPLDYDNLNFSEQIDWHIDNIYEDFWIKWVLNWLKVEESELNSFNIKFVTYESFIEDPLNYYREIGEFFDFDWSEFSNNDLLVKAPDPKTEVGGRIDFWRQKLSTSQIDKVQDLTPKNLLERFGWYR